MKASYVEYDKFTDSTYMKGISATTVSTGLVRSGGECMLVEDSGPDVLGESLRCYSASWVMWQVMKQTMMTYMIQDQMLKILKKIKKRKPLQM